MSVNFEYNFEELENDELKINGKRTDSFGGEVWDSIIINRSWISWIITTLRTATIDDYSKVIKLQKLGFSEDISDLLIRRYYEWNGKRFEIFGENGIIEGLKTINRTIDSIYGYSGTISPWEIGNLKMEGGCGQLNTVFSWQLLIDGGIVEYKTTIKIK